MKAVFLGFILVAFASSACLNSTELDGQCTDCGALDVLINKNCYPKMRGCLKQIDRLKCGECQFGYILNQESCTRQAVFNNNTSKQIPPVRIENQILTYQDIQSKLGDKYGADFNIAHDYFLNKYPQLGKGNVKNVTSLETKYGTILTIKYQSDSGQQYTAVARVSDVNKVDELSFAAATAPSQDVITAVNLIKDIQNGQLDGYSVYNLSVSGDVYTINYANNNGNFVRVQLNKKDLANPSTLASKLTVQNLTVQDFMLEKIREAYPYLKSVNVTSIDKEDNGLYIFHFGTKYTVSAEYNNGSFVINAPVSAPIVSAPPTLPPTIPQPTIPQPTGVITGGFSPFTNYSDPRYVSALAYSIQQIPELANATVTNVQSQVVAGTNFLISFQNQKTADKYQVKVWHQLNGSNVILEATKNGRVITSNYYNYNTDPNFPPAYNAAKNLSHVANIPPIQSVVYQQNGNVLSYKVIYSPTESMEFTYDKKTNETKLISYTVENDNINNLVQLLKPSAEKRSTSVLYGFLTGIAPDLLNAKVKSMNESAPLYYVELIAATGIYRAVIKDQNGVLNLVSLNKISNDTCYEYSLAQAQSDPKLKKIDDFLRANYPLNGYFLQVVQTNVKALSQQYRFLYGDSNFRQIEVYLSESGGQATVTKAVLLNYGYGVVRPNPTNLTYTKALAVLAGYNFTGSKEPLYTEANDTYIRTFYNDGNRTIELTINQQTKGSTFIVISTAPSPSNCQNKSSSGECLSCQKDELMYQGSCFKKMDECLFQAGALCLRCDIHYVISNYKCYRDCSSFFG